MNIERLDPKCAQGKIEAKKVLSLIKQIADEDRIRMFQENLVHLKDGTRHLDEFVTRFY